MKKQNEVLESLVAVHTHMCVFSILKKYTCFFMPKHTKTHALVKANV